MKIYTGPIAYRGGFDVSRLSGHSAFAPSWAILGPALELRRQGLETEESWNRYADAYQREMQNSWERDPLPWLELLDRDGVVLKCYCERRYLPRCHRVLLASILVEKGRELGVDVQYVGEAFTGWNIYSRSPDGEGLAAALTNPTLLSKRHGRINEDYPINFRGKVYKDVESAYLKLAPAEESNEGRDRLMIELIRLKFETYPWLYFAVLAQGGVPFLETCAHYTRARTESIQSWEGLGLKSRFIRNLIEAYRKAEDTICRKDYEVPQ